MYSSSWCGYCSRARRLLKSKGVEIEEIDVDERSGAREEMIARTGRRTVPQIFIGDTHVGGSDDLLALDASGGLEPLLNS
jgi:glutaredoxin 3